MNTYLARLQAEEIQILQAVDKACEKLNIKYVIISGTLLGAIRHKGFIPWDDDMDIGMERSDFDKFLKEGQNHLPKHLFIQHYTTEKNDNKIYIKVRNKNTLFVENDTEDMDVCQGIFVDVFPFDKCKIGKEKHEYRKRVAFNLLVQCYSDKTIKTVQNPIKRLCAIIVNKTYCKFVPILKVLKREEARRKKLDARGDDCYLLNMFAWNGTVTSDELFSRTKYLFENNYFWGPIDYDDILKKYYGDYMIIPPVEKQITHKPKKVLFELNPQEENKKRVIKE